jgi:glycerate 2-kinase
MASPDGIHILGGEPTVVLPPNPGLGGRNMALALLIAREIAGTTGIRVLVAGTDGTDGPTDAAGAIVDGTTWEASGAEALATANVAPWLDAKGALFHPGPTGTNVMDMLIAECRTPEVP